MGHGRYILYNAVNRAGANKSREVRGHLLAKVLAARRRDKVVHRKMGLDCAAVSGKQTCYIPWTDVGPR